MIIILYDDEGGGGESVSNCCVSPARRCTVVMPPRYGSIIFERSKKSAVGQVRPVEGRTIFNIITRRHVYLDPWSLYIYIYDVIIVVFIYFSSETVALDCIQVFRAGLRVCY